MRNFISQSDNNFAGYVSEYGRVENGRLSGYEQGVQGHPEMGGFVTIKSKNKTPEHRRRVIEAAKLYADALRGTLDPFLFKQAMFPEHEFAVTEIARRYPGIYGDPGGRRMRGLRETMSVTDYQALFVDVLDRTYYGYYDDYGIPNEMLVKNHDLRDFRLRSIYLLDGVVSPLVAMDPAAPPPQRALSGPVPQNSDEFPTKDTAPIQYQPLLYQAMTSVNWRAFVNDDLGIFRDLMRRLAMSASMGITKFITGLYSSATGPNAALYNSGYRNQIITANGAASNNPALSSQGIMDAFKILAGMRDSAGNPIMIGGNPILWYGPSYTAVAENLMSATKIMLQNEGGTGNTQGFPTQFVETANWLVRNMRLCMDPWLPIVTTTSGVAETQWGITIDPNSVARPSIEMGFLNGWRQPQILQKVGNTARMGGGVDQMLGDFNTMDSDMKVVTVFGGIQVDGRTTVASTGQGS